MSPPQTLKSNRTGDLHAPPQTNKQKQPTNAHLLFALSLSLSLTNPPQQAKQVLLSIKDLQARIDKMQKEKDVGEDALLQLHIEAEAGYRKRKTSGLQEDLFIEQPQVQRRPQSVPVQQQVKAIYSLLSPQTQDLTLSLFWHMCTAKTHTHKAALFPKARKTPSTAHFSNPAFTSIRERKQGKISIVPRIGQGQKITV